MSQIKVFNDNKCNCSVTSQGNVIGVLQYRHWYSSKAFVTMSKEDEYVIERKGFWGTLHEVKHHETVMFRVKTLWDGGIAIIKPGEKEHFYEFKPKGFFNNDYSLTNYKGEELLFMTTDFSWKKFTSDYSMDCNDNFGKSNLEQLLIMISVYHYKAVQAMAMAAVGN